MTKSVNRNTRWTFTTTSKRIQGFISDYYLSLITFMVQSDLQSHMVLQTGE